MGEGSQRHSNETYVRPAAFEVDYGVPAALCTEVVGQPGLFQREYTRATVSFDCRTNKSSIMMKS